MGRTKTEATGADFGKNDPGAKYGQGQDVGHGPNHDCLQCRLARKALIEQAHIPAGGAGDDPDAHFYVESKTDDNNVPGVSDQAPDVRSGVATDSFDPASGPDRSGESSIEIPAGTLQPGASVRFKTQPTRLIAELGEALDAAWSKTGLAFGEIPLALDGIEIVDALQEAMPGLGVMLMQGYIPNDKRWHVEMTTGNQRAHIKFIDREIAIKLCALTLLDGVKGAEFERALAPYNDPDPLAHFTGLTQARV